MDEWTEAFNTEDCETRRTEPLESLGMGGNIIMNVKERFLHLMS